MKILKLFFSFGDSGWGETYIMTADTLGAAKTDATALITARLACLPEACFLDWAVVSDSDTKKDGSSVLPATRSGGLVGATFKLNEPADALQFRFETATGGWSNRLIHGIPDRNIAEKEYDQAIVGDTFPGLLTTFLNTVKTKTAMKRVDKTTTPATVTTVGYDSYVFRKVTNKKCGRPFDAARGRRKAGS